MRKLMVQTAAGFTFLMVVLALALFLAAETLAYWQGWLYLADFAVCTILITVYLIKYDQDLLAGRVTAGPVAETNTFQKVIQRLASLFFIGLFIVLGLDHRFGWSNVPAVLSWIGAGFVAIGFYFVFLVFRENTFSRGTVEVFSGQKVITSGPYAVVRHPMYAGAGLLLVFTPIVLASWVAIPFVIPLMLVIVVRLLDEEKLLMKSLEG